ncbi:head-tail adaptor protein [Terribacillus sp. 7520-G]|uniref:phage head completion protein n=1 Tax=Terribacillus sp. 7520-G TaxID=2025389 RepID=UPI000BA6EF31|nr:head-tail adaptor protein [Terribacillus sp. 7520-G]PAD39814.1 hypothetical protein CHH53_04020 [Terribacillus sp. 7520-G]
MPITNPGLMNTRISFHEITPEKDVFGKPSKVKKVSEKPIFSCMSAVMDQFHQTRLATIGTIYEDTVTLIIRKKQKHPIDPTMRVKLDGDFYEIVKINPERQDPEYKTIIVKVVTG